MRQSIRTTCTRDCPDSCAIIAEVEDGRIVSHRGDPEHGITRGFLCHRGNKYLNRFYSTERILHAQRRTADGWIQITWDEALDTIAEQLICTRERHGALSSLVVNYSGIKGLVAKTIGRLFWRHLGGATFTRGGTSVEATNAAQRLDFGAPGTHAPEDHRNSSAFVVWGKNIAVTRPHAMTFVNMARKRGAPLVVIDPVRCATARRADSHLAVRPGSDGMLAIGVGRLLIERAGFDAAAARSGSIGFDAYREMVCSTSLEEVAAATDLKSEQIEQLADLYATTKPLATFVGLGPSYWRSGGANVRLIDALAFLSGNMGVPGGGANSDISGYAGFDFSVIREAPEGERRSIRMPRLGREILETKAPALKLGFIAGANPAATSPDTATTVRALRSLDFLVVVDQFMTATAQEADLVLPCTTYLETEDLVAAYGHHWIGATQAVVPPLGEARSDVDIYQALANRLGFGDALAGSNESWSRRLLGRLSSHGITPDSLKQRSCRNPLAVDVPFADGKVQTHSGKVELITNFEPRAPIADDELFLVATKTLKMVNAQINAEDLPDEPTVKLHPETLAARGFEPGTAAWVVSATGRARVRLAADESVRRDVLLFNPAAWRGDLQGVNQLREACLADMGDAAAMHETRVSLSPCAEQ